MGIVFGIHNELGPLCDERIYQDELAYRCEVRGIGAALREVPIVVSHEGFSKTHFIDLLVARSVIYELKTVKSLTGQHRKQVLNYLLLTGLQCGKLVNLRAASVEWSFVSTRLTPERRHDYAVEDQEWKDRDEDSLWLRLTMLGLLTDWGAFLAVELFYDAIEHFRGGEDKVVQRIDIVSDSRVVGAQRAHLLNPETAFKITAITRAPLAYEHHLRKFLSHTHLKAIQWVNFNHHSITFRTITG